MAGIFTRNALDKIIRNGELTEEQKTEQLFSLYGRALDDGYISKSAAEEAKNAAVEAAKAGIKTPEPIDPKTTPEYLELVKERDMLRTIGGDDFAKVKPKFREQVFGMLDRGEKAKDVSEQLNAIKEKYEEYFTPEQTEPKNSPQYSQ
jgi:DNA-binding NarL/FixJ family response regulator